MIEVNNNITQIVVDKTNPTTVITSGQQGPPGPRGQGLDDIQAISLEEISAYKIVSIFNGTFRIADLDTTANTQLGIILQSVSMSETCWVKTTGLITNDSWTLNEGPVYLYSNGDISQTPPTGHLSILIGYSTSPTSFIMYQNTAYDSMEKLLTNLVSETPTLNITLNAGYF